MLATVEPRKALATVADVRATLESLESVQGVKDIHDRLGALQDYARKQGVELDRQNEIATARLWCMRRAGELLGEIVKHGGDRRSESRSRDDTLKDLDITKGQSSHWQLAAWLPEPVFTEYIASKCEKGNEVTAAGLFQLAKQRRAKERIAEGDAEVEAAPTAQIITANFADFLAQDVQYGTIYADPPWQYGNQATRAATDNHYPTMTVPELCEIPVARVVADDAIIHLWTTNAFLFDAHKVMEAWGFEYRSVFVWVKPQMGIGNYWRVSHEFMLCGRRGNATFRDKSLMSWRELDREGHSKKPDVIRDMVEKAWRGPYLEMFGRQAHPGWSVFGNQVTKAHPRLPGEVEGGIR